MVTDPLEECNKNGTQKHIPIEEYIIKIMKVIDIWKKPKESNVLVTGNKAELWYILRKCLADKVPLGVKKVEKVTHFLLLF